MQKNSLTKKYPGRVHALPFPQKDWLNTNKPYTLEDLKGKVVILDFWTYCCINCIHVLPDLKKLEQRFKDEVVVIGVHSAKFENEKLTQNIQAAILRYQIDHPVINDDEMLLWREYGIRAWPTLVVIDPEGYVIGSLSGEGNYDTLEKITMTLIDDHKNAGTLKPSTFKNVLEATKVQDTPLAYPAKIIATKNGQEFFVTDSNHHRIIRFNQAGEVLSIIGSGQKGWTDGSYKEARFFQPQGLALDEDQNLLYVADTENHLIRQIDLNQKRITTIAGVGKQIYNTSPTGLAKNTGLNSPWDLYLKDGWLYIAMAGPHQIWTLDLKAKTMHLFAGTGRENIVDGPHSLANFAQPSGLTSDGQKLYVADSEVSAIRSVDLNTDDGMVKTLVGTGLFDFGDKDDFGNEALLQHPLGVFYKDGLVYVADTYNHKIKTINLSTLKVSTIFGTGKSGSENGEAHTATFFEPSGLTIVQDKIYITDTNNNAIRIADLTTQKVSTLELKGLTPPQDPINTDNTEKITATLKPQKHIPLILNVRLPEELKINERAPHEIIIHSQDLELDKRSFRLTFSEDNQAKFLLNPSTTENAVLMSLKATIYSCEKENTGLCSFKKFDWDVTVKWDEDAKDVLELYPSFL